MKIRHLLRTIIFGTLFFSVQSQSQTDPGLNSALDSFKRGDFQKSKVQIIRLIKANKKKSIYWFNLGHVYTKLNNYPAALKCYRNVSTLKSPLAPAAQYYEAKLLIEMGEIESARKILSKLLASSTLPKNLKTEVRELYASISQVRSLEKKALKAYRAANYNESYKILKSIPKEKLSEDGHILLMMVHTRLGNRSEFQEMKRSFFRMPRVSSAKRSLVLDLEKNFSTETVSVTPYTLAVDASVGKNSNVYADGKSANPLESVEYRLFAGGTYQTRLGHDEFLKAGYSFFKNSFQSAPELDSFTHSFVASFIKLKRENTMEVSPYFQLHNWDGVYVSSRIGVSSLYSQSTRSGETGVVGDLSKRSSIDDDYDYLDSINASGRGYISWWTPSLLMEANFSLGYDGTKDITFSDNSLLPLEHFFYGPGFRLIMKPADKFLITAQTAYLMREYANAARPEESRSDQELSYSLRANHYFIPSTSVYFLHEGLVNDSTLGEGDVRDKNYTVFTYGIGLTWEYL